MNSIQNKAIALWPELRKQLRGNVGEDVYSSWFARMELESVEGDSIRLSVPTRFLKSWIQAHYAERVLTCWQAEMPEVHRVDFTVRTAMRISRDSLPAPEPELRTAANEVGGSPLDHRMNLTRSAFTEIVNDILTGDSDLFVDDAVDGSDADDK
jgi:chromosomal replication initiation ATPase DnaA